MNILVIIQNIYICVSTLKTTTMLSISSFNERSNYWKELLQLFWLRELGCKSAFCLVKQVSKESAKTREFTSHLDLDASCIDSFFVYEVLTISNKEMESFYKHFTSFLKSLNKKQFIKFCSENKWFLSVILRAVSGSPSLSVLFSSIDVNSKPDLKL